MKKKIFFLFFLNSSILFSQASFTDLNNHQVLTPEVSSIRKYSETPVSYYTGIPEINIPVYTIQLTDFVLPISLSYHSGGIRTNEMAGWVGLGWNLNTLSPISRNVKGLYDEETYMLRHGNDNKTTIQTYLNLANIAESSASSPSDMLNAENQLKTYISNFKYGLVGALDFMPDEFFISIPGYSGKCMYSQDTNSFVLFPMDDIKINYVLESTFEGSRIAKWIVTGKDGTKYEFGEDGKDINYGSASTQAGHKGPTAWKIKRIETINREVITFNYEQISYFREDHNGQKLNLIMGNWDAYPQSVNFQIQTTEKNAVLTSIDFPSGRIIFNTSLNREDFTKMKKLDAIEVFNFKNESVKKVSLEYSYFTTIDGQYNIRNEDPHKRLKLNRIKYWNSTSANSYDYDFSYYEDMILPNRFLSFSQDYWGYFNGKNNSSLIPKVYGLDEKYLANRTPSEHKFNAFLLKDIIYPEGAKTEYVYERNTAKTSLITQQLPNLLPLTPNYNRELYIGATEEIIPQTVESLSVSGMFDQNQPNGVYWGFPAPSEATFPNTFYFRKYITLPDLGIGKRQVWFSFVSNFTKDYISKEGLDTYTNVYYRDQSGNYQPIFLAGGVTVAPIEKYIPADGIDSNGNANLLLEIVKISANGTGDVGTPNEAFSSSLSVEWVGSTSSSLYDDMYVGGARIKEIKTYKTFNDAEPISRKEFEYDLDDGKSSGLIYSIPVQAIQAIYEYRGGSGKHPDEYTINHGLQISSQSFTPSINTKGSSVGYQRVVENIFGKNNAYLGKIERKYDYLITPDENVIRSYDSYEGLHVALMQDLDWRKGNLLSEIYYNTNNEIVRKKENTYNFNHYSTDYLEAHEVSGINLDILGKCFHEYYMSPCSDIYPISFGYLTQSSTINPILGSIPTKKPYYTKKTGVNFLESTTVTENFPNNAITSTTQLYYEGNGHLQPTKIAVTNSSGERVETRTKYPPDVNEVELWSHNRIVPPIQTEKYKNNTLLGKQFVDYDYFEGLYLPESVNISKGENLLSKRIDYLKYDSNGKLLMYKKPDGHSIVYLWGYDNQFPIIKVENASYSQVIATGVDLWLLNDETSSDSSISIELQKVRDGLPHAMVTTYTYEPLVGVKSITDPKGLKTTYEYDSFNRLEFIKDFEGNILKEHKYNYKNQ